MNPRQGLLELYATGLAAVNGTSVVYQALSARAERNPCHVVAIGKAADAGTFLEASGDLIHVGVTGTNVMDVVIGLKVTGLEL